MVNVASGSKAQLPLPKVASERKLKATDSEPDAGEEWGGNDNEPSSDSGEDDSNEDDVDDLSLGGDSEESDVDVDAPRVAQWVDEDDLEQPEMVSGDDSRGNEENAENIVRVVYVSPGFG